MLKKFSLAMVLSIAAISTSHAHDSERLDLLERELIETQKRLLDTRKRLAILESKLRGQGTDQAPLDNEKSSSGAATTEEKNADVPRGSLAAWRELDSGMGTIRVLELLDDPERIKGGAITMWYYKNGGSVVFWDGYLNKWTEPSN